MLSVTLDTAELLVLLDALRAERAPGLQLELPAAPDARSTLMQRGQAQLRRRGLLTDRPDQSLALDEALILLGAVLAYPTLLCVSRLRSAAGAHSAAYAYSDGLLVEQRADGEHMELRSGTGLSGILARLRELLPPVAAQESERATLLISPAALRTVTAQLAAGDSEAAAATLAPFDAPAAVNQALLAALARPLLAGSMTLLRLVEGQPTAQRSPAFVADEGGVWWVAPALPNGPTLRIERMDGRRLLAMLAGQLRELGVAPRPA